VGLGRTQDDFTLLDFTLLEYGKRKIISQFSEKYFDR
jgi:hypothetical protein